MQDSVKTTIIISTISSLLTIGLFYLLVPPKKIIIHQEVLGDDKRLIAMHNDLLQQRSQTIGTSDFINSANYSKKCVVFMQVLSESEVGLTKEKYSASSGSGVIISSDGYIVTNHHVVQNATEIKVTMSDGRSYVAELEGIDEDTDLAIIKVEASGLPFLNFSDSDLLSVGEWVLAIGNPFNLESTVTAGIVSAKGRNINLFDKSKIETFIQTDAAVNVGSSGGALVNTQGQLVGVNTAILSNTGNYEGFSFAIPSNIVEKVYKDILEFGAVQRAWLGVTVKDVDSSEIPFLSQSVTQAVQIKLVNKNSAAYEAGLKKGDVLLEIDRNKILNANDFLGTVALYRPGDAITLKINRQGNIIYKKVTLFNYLNSTGFVTIRKDKVLRDLGIEIRNISEEEQRQLGARYGAKVISIRVGSLIYEVNMEQNFIISKVNGMNVLNAQQVIDLIKASNHILELEGVYEYYPGEYKYVIELNKI